MQPGSSTNVQLNCFRAGRKRKHLRVPTPSRSSWRRSSWDRCPLSSSCWIRPACQESSSLKRSAKCPVYWLIDWCIYNRTQTCSERPSGVIIWNRYYLYQQWHEMYLSFSFVFFLGSILPHSSDAQIWKQVQDVFSYHSLHWAGHHWSRIQG